MAVLISTKIFTYLICNQLKSVQHFHLCPTRRLTEKIPSFTRHGDDGRSRTHVIELDKDELVFQAIGATEELNAFIGVAREYVKENKKLLPLSDKLRRIQIVLVDVIDIVNNMTIEGLGVTKVEPTSHIPHKFSAKDTSDLENWITYYSNLLPPIENMVVPGGGRASTSLHVARTICRRAERFLVTLNKQKPLDKEILPYMNRLSSYLAQAARLTSKFAERAETIYDPKVKRT